MTTVFDNSLLLLPHGGLELFDDVRDAMVERLREVAAECGEDVTLAEFRRRTGVSYRVVQRKFGTWGEMRIKAGLPRHGRRKGWGAYRSEEILAALEQLARERGERITQGEFSRATGISQKAVIGHFGTWWELRKQAGLNPTQHRPPQFSDERLLAEFTRVAKQLGRIPTGDEFNRLAEFSMATLYRRFGGKAEVVRRYCAFAAEKEGRTE